MRPRAGCATLPCGGRGLGGMADAKGDVELGLAGTTMTTGPNVANATSVMFPATQADHSFIQAEATSRGVHFGDVQLEPEPTWWGDDAQQGPQPSDVSDFRPEGTEIAAASQKTYGNHHRHSTPFMPVNVEVPASIEKLADTIKYGWSRDPVEVLDDIDVLFETVHSDIKASIRAIIPTIDLESGEFFVRTVMAGYQQNRREVWLSSPGRTGFVVVCTGFFIYGIFDKRVSLFTSPLLCVVWLIVASLLRLNLISNVEEWRENMLQSVKHIPVFIEKRLEKLLVSSAVVSMAPFTSGQMAEVIQALENNIPSPSEFKWLIHSTLDDNRSRPKELRDEFMTNLLEEYAPALDKIGDYLVQMKRRLHKLAKVASKTDSGNIDVLVETMRDAAKDAAGEASVAANYVVDKYYDFVPEWIRNEVQFRVLAIAFPIGIIIFLTFFSTNNSDWLGTLFQVILIVIQLAICLIYLLWEGGVINYILMRYLQMTVNAALRHEISGKLEGSIALPLFKIKEVLLDTTGLMFGSFKVVYLVYDSTPHLMHETMGVCTDLVKNVDAQAEDMTRSAEKIQQNSEAVQHKMQADFSSINGKAQMLASDQETAIKEVAGATTVAIERFTKIAETANQQETKKVKDLSEEVRSEMEAEMNSLKDQGEQVWVNLQEESEKILSESRDTTEQMWSKAQELLENINQQATRPRHGNFRHQLLEHAKEAKDRADELDDVAEEAQEATERLLDTLFDRTMGESRALQNRINEVSEILAEKMRASQAESDHTDEWAGELDDTLQGVQQVVQDTQIAAGPARVAELTEEVGGIMGQLNNMVQQGIIGEATGAVERAKGRMATTAERSTQGMDKCANLTQKNIDEAKTLFATLEERGMHNPEVAKEAIAELDGFLAQVNMLRGNISAVTGKGQENLGGHLRTDITNTVAQSEEQERVMQTIRNLEVVTAAGKETQERLEGQAEMARDGMKAGTEVVQSYYKNAHQTIRLLRDPVTHAMDTMHGRVENLTWDARKTAKVIRYKQQDVQRLAGKIRMAANLVEDTSKFMGAAKGFLGAFGFK